MFKKGETFYYFYRPTGEILKGTEGSLNYKMDGTTFVKRKTSLEAIEDSIKYLSNKHDFGYRPKLEIEKTIKLCIELWDPEEAAKRISQYIEATIKLENK